MDRLPADELLRIMTFVDLDTVFSLTSTCARMELSSEEYYFIWAKLADTHGLSSYLPPDRSSVDKFRRVSSRSSRVSTRMRANPRK